MQELVKHYYLECNKSCSESILIASCEHCGMKLEPQTLKAIGAFSAGACCGSMCGASAGACAAIALRFGEADICAHENSEMRTRCKAFMEEFSQTFGSELCREIKPKYFTKENRCVAVPEKAAEILEKYLK